MLFYVIKLSIFFIFYIYALYIALYTIFQGHEWLSSRLMLMDLIPIMTQFDILPLINIGGTLDISVHLEIEKVKTLYCF